MGSVGATIRTALAITIAALAVSAVVLVSVPACDPLPDGICRGETVNGLTKANQPEAGRDCTSCLQRECCDFVGFCSDRNIPDASCVEQFRDAHACVVEAGATKESRCTSRLIDDGGKDLYACMRGKCGPECTVPYCKLDNTVVLFGTAQCDRCMGSACCDPINTCYQDRRCKLIIECVLKSCGRVGEGMNDLRVALERGAQTDTCDTTNGDDNRPGGGGGPGGPPSGASDFACILRCLDEFAPDDGGTSDDFTARCHAFKVYTCGARLGCGDECIVADAGATDAGSNGGDGGDASDASDDADAGDAN